MDTFMGPRLYGRFDRVNDREENTILWVGEGIMSGLRWAKCEWNWNRHSCNNYDNSLEEAGFLIPLGSFYVQYSVAEESRLKMVPLFTKRWPVGVHTTNFPYTDPLFMSVVASWIGFLSLTENVYVFGLDDSCFLLHSKHESAILTVTSLREMA